MNRPRFIRNFWIEAKVNGYSKEFKFGPKTKEGGFELVIKQRDNNDIVVSALIRGFVDDKGNICLLVEGRNEEVIKIETKR